MVLRAWWDLCHHWFRLVHRNRSAPQQLSRDGRHLWCLLHRSLQWELTRYDHSARLKSDIQSLATLNVDLHPTETGLANVAVSVTRCLAAAVGLGVMQPL